MTTLRVAIPNKGSLSASALELFSDAGYRVHSGRRDLRVVDTDNDIIFFFQRPRDIATYVGSGTLDIGVTGEDLLVDSGAPAESMLELGFAHSEFRFAALPGSISSIDDLDDRRVATSFSRLVAKYLAGRGVQVRQLVQLDGAVENAIELGVADAIADVVETGESLRSAGLVAFGEPIMTSQAVLIRSTQRIPDNKPAAAIEALVNRLRGVLNSRRYGIMEYDCPKTVLEQACALTPGIESPTISPLADGGWVAVRSMVLHTEVQPIMDELEQLGCKAIFVTALRACRV